MNKPEWATDESAINDVILEVNRARALHGDYNSAHEAYAVIKEELEEFWDIVKMKTNKRSVSKMRQELSQVACTAIRAISDLGLWDGCDCEHAGKK